jgi:hypothetical protein
VGTIRDDNGPLSIRRPAAVAQSVYFACGLKATEFVVVANECHAETFT